ncbi:MAG: shikimate dehydrogenase [Fimbriimonadaceae bacterium]|nr:shikimate dehydrogenase [Fimbriimonadaceae bacterium]QYK59727.1 MAG: shikimate dehydrogenase [Fimbriimonadaceae bacterium]
MSFFEWREAPPGDFAVVGDPVAHSLSPRMHQAAYASMGLDLTYRAVRVPRGDLAAALQRLAGTGYRGVNVTVPLKEEAFALTRGGDPRLGAVNTVALPGLEATNTDAPGFLVTLDVEPGPALVLGAGGSARALAVALHDRGFQVRLFNRSADRARALTDRSGVPILVMPEPDPSDCSLILNATSAGLQGQAPKVIWERAVPGALAYDLLYGPGSRPFLKEAAQRGLRTQDGLGLLVEQGALAFEWWLQAQAPRGAMMEAVQ